MRRKKKVFTADYSIVNGKYFFYYDVGGGSCFGSYPKPTYNNPLPSGSSSNRAYCEAEIR